MKRIYTSLLAVLMAVLALPISAATITYDFVAAHETYGDVTITSSGTSAGKNGMGTALTYPKELQDLFNGNFGFFFRNECTVKLTSEGLVMSGSKDTYISILNLKADDEVTVNFTGSILFCDNPVTNIEGITSQWTACESGTTYTLIADGNFNVQWKKSKTTITSITVESSAPETVSTPGITVTGVDGVNRVVTITPGVGSFGSSCNTYYTLDGTDPTTESDSYTGPITLSETKTVKAISTLANGTTSAIASLEVVAGESIKLNATATLTDITAEGNIYKFNVSNTNLIGNPEITYSYTFGDNQGTGDTYTTTGTGKLSIIASAQGYESSDALVVEVFEYEAGEGLSLKDANILAEDDAAWTYNAEGTRYANWSGYNGVSKANYPYWTPTTEGKGKIGNITFVPNDNVLMRTIGFIHNSGSQNLSVTDLPENTTVKFVVSTYLANPFNVFVDAIDGIATYSIGAGNTGLAVESIQLFTKKKPAFDPATLIANANFEADEPIANKVCTYAKDVQEGQVANMQTLTGWTIVENGDARAAGTFAYGSTAILGGDGGNVPAAGPNGETTGKALGLEAVWSATTQYTQDVTLPAGEYLFEAVVYNAAGTATLASNLIGIDGNYCTTKNYPVGKWTKDQVKFTLAEEKTVTVSLGINAGDVGNGSAPHLFIDHVRLYGSDEIAAQELAAAKENALSTIGALPTGDVLFLYDATAIEAAKAAVNSAETIEAVNAAVAAALAAQNKPAADKAYTFQLSIEGETPLYMALAESGITIAEEATPLKFVETENEGQYNLSNEDGTLFVGLAGGNAWTMSTTADKKAAWTFTPLPDGAYRINNLVTAGRFVGTNAADKAAGSSCYADKQTSNGNVDWLIAEYVAPVEPEFQPAYGTLWTEEQGSQVDENEFNYITLENKYFKGLVKEGDTIKVAISHVGNQPSSRARIITEGTLNLTIDNAGESKTIQQDMTSADLVLDADEIANIQNGANVVLSWKNMTVAKVDLVEKKAEIDPTLLEKAEGLASDANAVAVGKLLAAIEAYKKDGIAETLQDAMAQFKADNADQVADETAKVATNGWKKFDGSNAGVCDTQYAPAITTYDGRTANLAEVYESTVETTGTIIYQDITGLTNGKYKVGFYGNAFFTSGRGFDSTMEDGAEDVAYVFANEQKEFITARIATSTTENNFRQFDVEVTDGTIKLGMGKDKPGTNWHTMQIYQLTWFTTAKELFAAAQVDLKATIAAAEALKTDYRTEGLDAFNDAIALAKQGVESNWYNISEIQSMISGLKDAMEAFKVANYYKFNDNLVAYVIDAETGKSIAAGHDWGTRGIVNEAGLDLTFENTDKNKVFLNTQVSNGANNNYLGNNLYMDGAAFAWAFEYQGFGFHITNGTQYISIDENDNLVLSDTPREWIVVTAAGVKEQRLDEMAEATPENPADATFLLQNPNFNRNDQRVAAWEVSDDCTNKNLNGGNNVNNCAESYHSTFTISQTITDAPEGTYELRAQGFYRQDNDATEDAPVFFINDKTTEVPVKTGEEGSMSAASESFTAGLYNCEPVAVFVENGTLTVGVKATGANQWVIFDNFRLTYYGSQNTVGISEVNNNVLNNVKTIYNLNGQKVQKAQKGLYIINGKKTVVK